MPNWRKVLLSGSKAAVFDITASNLPGEPDKTTDVVVISDTGRFLTASRNDFGAASGPNKAIQFAYTEDGTVFQNSGSDKFTFDEESVELIISAAGEGQINIGRTDKPSSSETLGSLNFVGTGSFTMEGPTAKIEAVATQDYTVHAKGGKLNFYTSDNGDAGTPSGLGNPKMVISESGILFDPSNNGYEIGISQEKVGGSATMEFTTEDGGGNQATRLLLRGNGEFGDIEFYSGNSGSETQIGAISSEFKSFAFGNNFGSGSTLDDNIKKATILAFGNISTTGSEGHITASGNISASGYISSSYAYISENGGSKPTLTIERQSGQPSIQSTNWFIADATGSAAVNPGNKAAINYWSDRHILLANGGGKVGIGDFGPATDPGERLEVRGNISASGTIVGTNIISTTGTPVDNDFAKFTDANTIEGRSIAETKLDLSLNNVTNESKATMFTNPSFTGTVEIPGTLRHTGDTNTYMTFSTDQIDFYAGGVRMLTLDETTQDTIVINENSLDVDFRVEGGGDEYALFVRGSDDHIGIGTSSPGYKLDIYDSVQTAVTRIWNNLNNDNADGLYIRVGDTSTESNTIGQQAASTTYTNPNFVRFINGNNQAVGCIAKNGNSTYYGTTSDKKLKKDIKPLKEGLDTLLKIKPKEFKWKKGDDKIQHGFIAQEINEIYPHATIPPRDSKEYWQIEHSKLVPILVKSIQEQQQMIEQLKEEILNLKNNG